MMKPPPGHTAADKAKAQRNKERGITDSNKPGDWKNPNDPTLHSGESDKRGPMKNKRDPKTGEVEMKKKPGLPGKFSVREPNKSVNASKKKKNNNGDVDEWGSGEAVAQKDKRQADRKKEIGQKSVPHKYGRSQTVSPTHPHTSALHKAGEKAVARKKKPPVDEVESGSGDLPGRDSTGAVKTGKPTMRKSDPEKDAKERAAEKERARNANKVNTAAGGGVIMSSRKSKVKESFYERVTLLNEIGRAETDAEAGAYSGGAKRPASRAGRATDGGDQTSQEQENRRKEQQADIERSTGVKLNSSKRSKGKV